MIRTLAGPPRKTAPFPWVRASAAEAKMFQAFRAASGAVHLKGGGRSYRVELPERFEYPYRPALWLCLDVGGRRAWIDTERIPFLDRLGYAPGTLEVADVPSPVLAAMAESWLAGVFKSAAPHPIKLEEAGPGAPPADPEQPLAVTLLELRGEADEENFRARLHTGSDEQAILATRLQTAAKGCANPGPEDIPVLVRLGVGKARLSLAEFAGLQQADIVLLKEVPSAKGGLRVCAGDRDSELFTASYKEGSVMLEEKVEEKTKQAQAADGAAAVPEAPLDKLEAVEVALAFDMGSRFATLSEIKGLTPGAVMALPDNPEGRVNIRVSGAKIGTGTLIMVDDRAGVRIDTLAKAPPRKEAP
jgi:type III secretion system YscQ/HrcQ family protein